MRKYPVLRFGRVAGCDGICSGPDPEKFGPNGRSRDSSQTRRDPNPEYSHSNPHPRAKPGRHGHRIANHLFVSFRPVQYLAWIADRDERKAKRRRPCQTW